MTAVSIPQLSGIYQIQNLKTLRKYIGSSEDIPQRWKSHIEALQNRAHGNLYLQSDWIKYGGENFSFTVLEYCASNELENRERSYLPMSKTSSAFKAQGFYNMKPVIPRGKRKKKKMSAAREFYLKNCV